MQEFRHAARGVTRGLHALHVAGGVHHDVRAPNVCWQQTSARTDAVLVDLSTCGPADKNPQADLKDWTPRGSAAGPDLPTLNDLGAYDEYSDMRQCGLMLFKLSQGQSWQSSSHLFCQALLAKRCTSSEALAHEYLQI